MPRIEPPKRNPWWIRTIFFLCRRMYGRTFMPLQVAAHVPRFMIPFLMTNAFAHGRGTLSDDTRLLAMQLVGEINQCSWCIDYGRSLTPKALLDKVQHLRQFATYNGFSDAERAALRYAYEATQTPVDVSDATFAALRQHYSEPQIVELTFAVAIENFFNRVNAPLGVEAEGFCAIPDLSQRGDADAQRQSA
jgi:alkylhydroperoxidase family enzyme